MEKGAGLSAQLIEILLLPIIRFCLHRSIKFQEFSEVSRHLFVRLAEEALSQEGHGSNVSRVAIATGLQRREVNRLLKEKGAISPEPSVLHKVIGQWEGDERFLDEEDNPRALTFKGGDSEFSELVRSVSQDLNVYTVLFELERLSMVRKDGEQLTLIADALNPGKDVKRGIELLSSDVSDLIGSVEENLFGNSSVPNHHIKTHYDNIIVEALPKIRKWFLTHGAKFHREARAYLSKFDKDLQPHLHAKEGNARVAIGSFSVTSEIEKKKG